MNKERLRRRKMQIKACKVILAHLSIFINQYNEMFVPKIYVKVAIVYEDIRNIAYARWV